MRLSYLLIMLAMSLSFSSVNVLAAETFGEKLDARTNDAQREANKAVNRAKEAACPDSDAECLKEKAKNRAGEAYDATKDKASEIKNKVD
jgi:hypothetical protein